VRNSVIRIFFSVLGSLFGWMADRFGLMHALVAAGGIFTILETVAVVNFLRVNRVE